jgi:hypothetical protein
MSASFLLVVGILTVLAWRDSIENDSKRRARNDHLARQASWDTDLRELIAARYGRDARQVEKIFASYNEWLTTAVFNIETFRMDGTVHFTDEDFKLLDGLARELGVQPLPPRPPTP